MFGPSPSGQLSACSEHHQYSSSVSPFQAKTGTPASAMAAAAWSCVEKMLHDAQRTSAPRATSVSISTAVWTVMCSEPVMRAPLSGCASAYSARVDIRPGHLVLGELDLLAAEGREREIGDLEVFSGDGGVHATSVRAFGVVSKRWCFSCSQRSQSGTGTCSGRSGSGLEPVLGRGSQRVVAAQPQREREVGEPDLVLGEQLAQGAQALQLGRAVEAVAGLRAAGSTSPTRST